MLFSKQGLIDFERAIRISNNFSGNVSVAKLPFYIWFSMQVFLDDWCVQKSIDSNMIKTPILSGLAQAFLVQVVEIGSRI